MIPWLRARRRWTSRRSVDQLRTALGDAPFAVRKEGAGFVVVSRAVPASRFRAQAALSLSASRDGALVAAELTAAPGEAAVVSLLVAALGALFALLTLLNAWVFGLTPWPLVPAGAALLVIAGSWLLFRVDAARLGKALASHLDLIEDGARPQ
jgi:hypothetical protein